MNILLFLKVHVLLNVFYLKLFVLRCIVPDLALIQTDNNIFSNTHRFIEVEETFWTIDILKLSKTFHRTIDTHGVEA